jgi:hypothetical protein
MPCQFPAGLKLEKLAIQGVNFAQPSLKSLPVGLQELALDLSDGGVEDGADYLFPNLDVTDLPPTLIVLKIAVSFSWSSKEPVWLTGAVWPPALATVQLRGDVEVDDSLLRSLPAGVTVETVDDSDSWFE